MLPATGSWWCSSTLSTVVACDQHCCTCNFSKKLEVPGDLVDLALGCGSNTQNGGGTTGDLRAACIMDDLRAKAQANGLRLQHEHVVLAVDLERDLGLAESLPALQHWMRRVCANERLVACESGM
jgi:hypothetical protein